MTSPENSSEEKQITAPTRANPLRAFAKSWLPFIVFGLALYFGNVELQSYLGRQALAETGLTHLSLEQAFAKAQREEKLVLADMSAIWCPTCRKLDQQVFSNDQVKQAINEKYVFARIEYESDAGKAFMKKYNVSGFPTLLILNANGEKLVHLPLTFDPESFLNLI